MSKELIENLLIEFDEMGFEPTTLCDTKKEIDSFRNRLKQVLDYLKAIDNANPSEALEELEKYIFNEWKQNHVNFGCDYKLEAELNNQLNNLKSIKQALLKSQQDKIIADFIREHYKLSNDINKNYLELKKPITEEEHIKFKENL